MAKKKAKEVEPEVIPQPPIETIVPEVTPQPPVEPIEPEVIPQPEFYTLKADGDEFPEHDYPLPVDILDPVLLRKWKRKRVMEYCARFYAIPEQVKVL